MKWNQHTEFYYTNAPPPSICIGFFGPSDTFKPTGTPPPILMNNVHLYRRTISAFLYLDGTKVIERIIGVGGTGIVIERGQRAVKNPRILRPIELNGLPVATGRLTPEEGDYDERVDLISLIQDEKAIYRRLGDHPGIVRCFNLSSDDPSIEMDLMKNGDLRRYLDTQRPEKSTQLAWLVSMAHTLSYIHRCHIIVADVRSTNILVTDDGCDVQFCDFDESVMMPPDWDLNGSDEHGFSTLTDLGQFGALMFEIVTGERCEFCLVKHSDGLYTWPLRDNLPRTTDTWLGHIIEKCWTQKFTSAQDLAAELSQEAVGEETCR